MKKISSVFLAFTFLLAACTPATPPTTSAQATEPSATDASIPAEATETTASAREAVLSEIENTVSTRKTSADELVAAEKGMSILESGSVETGEDGRVRVDLMPEGTIVRVGPNSAFSFPKLTDENGKPKTTIQLLFGKVFILLKGGSLNVETPSGVASVRGSLLSVEYDPNTGRTSAVCMEGDCAVQGENGEETELPEGQESFIDEGEDPMDPFLMDQDEVQDWLDQNPDLEFFMPELPDPEDYPDLPPDFDGNPEDIPTDEAPTEVGQDDSNNQTAPPVDEDAPPDDGSGASNDGGDVATSEP